MSDDDLTPDQIAAITAYVDIEAPPPDEPTAHVIFGTNQAQPAAIVAGRYRQGLAPLVIATGGINRHNGVVEGQMFRLPHRERGTGQLNPRRGPVRRYLAERRASAAIPAGGPRVGPAATAVTKWYHRRAVHTLRTLLPEAGSFYAISWEPVYAGALVTRDNWPKSPDGRRRVIREWQEVPRRISDGRYREAVKSGGVWH